VNLEDYIKRRKSLNDLNIVDLSRNKYNKEKDDYKKLIKISDDLKKEESTSIIFKYLYFLFPIILSFGLSLGYVDKSTNSINILFFILMIIVLPFILMSSSLIISLYKKSSNSCFDFLTNKIKNEIIKDGIKSVSCFYLQGIAIVFSLVSVLILLFLTAIESYKFYFATTWLSTTFFTSIIDFFSLPLKVIYPSIIPSYELIVESSKTASLDSTWLWFLISLVFIWIVIPRFISLLIALYFSKNSLKNSFIENDKSKRILEYLKPKITTTQYVHKDEEFTSSNLNKNDNGINIEEEKEDVYSNILLYSLNENAINAIKTNKKYSNINIQTYNRNIDFKQFHSKVLILINFQSSPKMIAINMMRKLSHCLLSLKFVDDNGNEVLKDSNISEWKRFLKQKDINIKVNNE